MSRIFVRYSLWIEDEYGFKREAGARLHKGESQRVFPRECMDGSGKLVFTFDDAEKAETAAAALTKYVNAKKPKKIKT